MNRTAPRSLASPFPDALPRVSGRAGCLRLDRDSLL